VADFTVPVVFVTPRFRTVAPAHASFPGGGVAANTG
jgi:hypothetical protein